MPAGGLLPLAWGWLICTCRLVLSCPPCSRDDSWKRQAQRFAVFSGIVLCSACPVTEVAYLAVGNLDPCKHSSAATIVDLALLQRWKLMRETSWDKPSIPSASRQVSRHPLHASAFYTLGQPPVMGPLAFDQARLLAEQANTMPYAVLCLPVALGRCGGGAQSCSRCSQVRWNRQQCHQACALHFTSTT